MSIEESAEGNGKSNGHSTVSEAEMRALVASALVDRIAWMRQAGITFDGKRDLYEVLGYARQLEPALMRLRYSRGGIAGRIVDALPKATWRGGIELIEDEDPKKETQFEAAWNLFADRLHVREIFERVDILSRLSTYAVLLIGAPGDLSTPLPRGNDQSKILYLTPFLGAGGPGFNANSVAASGSGSLVDATIQEFDLDIKSERFGLPNLYNLRRTNISSPELQRPVHFSRIIHVAEGCLDDEVYGQPALQRPWNLLDDLDKVTGGGAEAFWLRANQGTLWNLDKDMKDLAEPEKQAFREQIEKFEHGMSRNVRSRGVTVSTLGSDVANFASPTDAILTQLAGATAIPKRILTGSEMGELASSQDRENWKDQVNGRRESHAGPNILQRLADRLIEYGYLPKPVQYKPRWGKILNLTEDEKEAGALSWSQTKTSEGNTFSNDEIRDRWYEMEPLPPAVKEALKPIVPPAPAAGALPFNKRPKPALVAAMAEDAEELEELAEDLEEILRAAGDVEGHPFHGNQYSSGRGSKGESQHLASAGDAYHELIAGRVVAIAPADLSGVLRKAAKGSDHPDLTKLNIDGTRVFGGGLNIKRDQMPQVPADQRDAYIEWMRAKGITVTQESVKPLSLLPSQGEIDAKKVAENIAKYDSGKTVKPVFASKDDYVLDGHHRWATMTALQIDAPKENWKMPVIRVDVAHGRALQMMHAFDKEKGIKRSSFAAAEAANGEFWFDAGTFDEFGDDD